MDGSLFLVIRQNTSLARRCRKGAIHPITRSPRPRARAPYPAHSIRAPPEAQQRPLPDAENFGGEVSSCCSPEMLNASRIYSPLIFAALMIGIQRAISLFTSAASG